MFRNLNDSFAKTKIMTYKKFYLSIPLKILKLTLPITSWCLR